MSTTTKLPKSETLVLTEHDHQRWAKLQQLQDDPLVPQHVVGEMLIHCIRRSGTGE